MVSGVWIVLAVLVVVIVYAVATYNRLVSRRNMAREGWSGIDVQLKRRADLIPNLVRSVQGYAAHERGVFDDVTAQRAKSMQATGVAEQAQAAQGLSSALGRLFAVAEAYPALKADQNFIALQDQLAEIEDALQLARRYYNGTARDMNNLVESFPSMIVARAGHFETQPYFEIEDASERAVPRVAF
ncbi:LemA family protein [Chitinasiproducens palmae]|uniref:LemA protein n=1 Tax=Chitinasiproducens palmae TaxID=1770053 RepID=A0A1H2PKP0_9BURK|nr:LemA family protein [Chitinasiproducens palmae]SDV46139.1 LemA protein [Chitinasiproducens palmae]